MEERTNSRWYFTPARVLILYIAALILGSETALLSTGAVGTLGGVLQIAAMLFVTAAVVLSSRIKKVER